MKPYADNIQTFTAMFEGFAQAIQRFDVSAKERDATQTFVSLFEALNWTVALDDRTGQHWTPEGRPLNWGWREKVRGADIMGGVRFARNSVHHDWSDALELDETGRAYPKTFPVVFFEWRWRSAVDLAKPKRLDPHGAVLYQEQLQGQSARDTLRQLASVFNFLRRLMEPWTLRP
jgi:hypothetical protein